MYPMDNHSQLADSKVSNENGPKFPNKWQVQGRKESAEPEKMAVSCQASLEG